MQTSMTTRKGVYKSFHVAEQQMLAALNARKGEVKVCRKVSIIGLVMNHYLHTADIWPPGES